MAIWSKTYYSNSDRGSRLRMIVDVESQNNQANTSRVRVRTFLDITYATFSGYTITSFIDGLSNHRINWSSNKSMLSYNSSMAIMNNVDDIKHDDNGYKQIKINAQLKGQGGYSPNTLIATTGIIELPKIPRISSGSSSGGVFGSPMPINIKRALDSYTHNIKAELNGKTADVGSNVGTSVNWTPPVEWESTVAGNSADIKFTITTMSGNTQIGTSTFTASVLVRDDAVGDAPSVKITELNTALGIFSDQGIYLQSLSNLRVEITPTDTPGIVPNSYSLEIVGTNITANTKKATLPPLPKAGDLTLRATVIDKRGRASKPKDVPLKVLPYFPPTLSFTAYRTNENIERIQVNRNASVAPLTVNNKQLNQMHLSFSVAEGSTGTNLVYDAGDASGDFYTVSTLTNSQANLKNTYSKAKTYRIVGTISDNYLSSKFEVIVGPETVVMYYDNDNKVGIGKVAELGGTGSLDVAGDIFSRGLPIQQYQFTSRTGASPVGNITDMNTLTNPGFYNVDAKAKGNPTGTWGYCLIYSNWGVGGASLECVQIFIGISGNAVSQMYIRHHKSNTTVDSWDGWKTYVTADHPAIQFAASFLNTGWRDGGFEKTQYKRFGDMIAINYDFKAPGGNIEICKLPPGILDLPEERMFNLTGWSVDGRDNCHAQINKNTGIVTALNTKKDMTYKGQLTIML